MSKFVEVNGLTYPAKAVVMPNGYVLNSAWHEPADRTASGKLRPYAAWLSQQKQAHREQRNLCSQEYANRYR